MGKASQDMTQRLIAFQLRLCAWYMPGSSSGNSLSQQYCAIRWKLRQLNYARVKASRNRSITQTRQRVRDTLSTDHAMMHHARNRFSVIPEFSTGYSMKIKPWSHFHRWPTFQTTKMAVNVETWIYSVKGVIILVCIFVSLMEMVNAYSV